MSAAERKVPVSSRTVSFSAAVNAKFRLATMPQALLKKIRAVGVYLCMWVGNRQQAQGEHVKGGVLHEM